MNRPHRKPSDRYACSLVLAAHGSLASVSANAPFYEMAEELQQHGIFAKVTPALLNGSPRINEVLSLLPAGDVVVVPLMTSEGYYCKQVLPDQLKSNPEFEQFRVMITPAIGVHPMIPAVVADRVRTLADAHRINNAETTAVIVGHGTTRHPDSGKATVALCDQVRRELGAAASGIQVEAGFIDQQPDIQKVAATLTGRNVIVIPFLISRGPHATEDVPGAFGLPTGDSLTFPVTVKRAGGLCICDGPVGLYPEVTELCLQMAADRMTGLETVISSS
ncbi:MAG: CbiX/SirB N-terminal domain-containing protein [Planctomycetota bacterium]